MQILWKLAFVLFPELNFGSGSTLYQDLGACRFLCCLGLDVHLLQTLVSHPRNSRTRHWMLSQGPSTLPGLPQPQLSGSRMYTVSHFMSLFSPLSFFLIQKIASDMHIFKSSGQSPDFFFLSSEFSPLETIMGFHQESDNIQARYYITFIFLSSEINSVNIFHISFTKHFM